MPVPSVFPSPFVYLVCRTQSDIVCTPSLLCGMVIWQLGQSSDILCTVGLSPIPISHFCLIEVGSVLRLFLFVSRRGDGVRLVRWADKVRRRPIGRPGQRRRVHPHQTSRPVIPVNAAGTLFFRLRFVFQFTFDCSMRNLSIY